MTVRIYPYKLRSESARTLRDGLDAGRLVKPDGEYVPREHDVIVNWGSARRTRHCG